MKTPSKTGAARGQALLLIDFQRDFLADDGRMPVARHQVAPVIAAANAAISAARAARVDIVAIGNEFRADDWLMNLLRRRAAIAGTPGAAWDPRVDIGGATYFPKWRSDAFSNPALGRFLSERRIGEVVLAGLFARACVTATAKGALARGLRVRVLEAAIADGSDRARAAALSRLRRRGASPAPGVAA